MSDKKPTNQRHTVYLHKSQMWLREFFRGIECVMVRPMPHERCPACGEELDTDSYCPTVHAKLESARAEFGDDEIAYSIAEEYDWFHRHPTADKYGR